MQDFTERELLQLGKSEKYWQDRQANAQATLTSKNIKETEKQLEKYYLKSMNKVLGQFSATYSKITANIADGVTPNVSDLYKLSSYWEMQGQLKQELTKLGNKQISLFEEWFAKQYMQIYESIALPSSGLYFSQINKEAVLRMINEVWCADGQSWSNRVWTNTNKLQQALNDNLVHCVVTGGNSDALRNMLMEDFRVSYNRADSLVRTEMAHIQTQASQQRYIDAGVKRVQVWADYDERRCDVCGKLHEKIYPVYARMPIPAHPRCRCTIIPVIED